ncbi:MAG: NAD(P)/FAD-dependent oxidoreductase [Massilia sp.]|nr:NAD(P)/FAD-dependent oxidoreductase [Massilia sp.]
MLSSLSANANAKAAADDSALAGALPDTILDVLIVGAGLSGIGAAAQLAERCPDKRYAILETRAAIGGTWDLFRYPGIRSDSDMYTLGYAFKPWTGAKAIADGPAILAYIRETARDKGIEAHIRFGHKVVRASWSSLEALWTVDAEQPDGTLRSVRARFLHMCSGYYSYDHAWRPFFPDEGRYQGRIVQPQFWPQDLDYAGKRVVVIGSGATAVTLVPAMAQAAAHVTMLQRSPTYVVSRPSEYRFARRLQARLPPKLAYWATRWRVILESMLLYRIARSKPDLAKRKIVQMAAHRLGKDYDVATHFTPNYKPWDQRVCVVPDGDLFRAIREGRAEVVTDHVSRFTERGILLQSGRELEADVVVMATGLSLSVLGGARILVDGKVFHPSEAMSYKGMMLSDLPNSVMTFGYTNASWTLKADLTAAWACRLLKHMDRKGHRIAVVRREVGVEPEPFLSFTSSYVQRAASLLPKQGSRRPWQVYQNYLQDMFTIRFGRIADGVIRFGTEGKLP